MTPERAARRTFHHLRRLADRQTELVENFLMDELAGCGGAVASAAGRGSSTVALELEHAGAGTER
jgi:hypothetical protein